jgi:thioredoxin
MIFETNRCKNLVVFSAVVLLMLPWSIGCNPNPIAVTDQYTEAEFDELIGQDKLVLVKFGATWCQPCNMLDQELKSIKADPPPGVEVHSVDIDSNPGLASQFGIQGIPRMMLFRGGEKLGDQVGYQDESMIRSWITSAGGTVGEVTENPYAL